jgi:mRNA interferase RelE/StbE
LAYKILIDKKVIKDLKRIDKTWQEKIVRTIKNEIAQDPYRGKKLIGSLSPFWRWRVGDYRIIYTIDDEIVTVEIVKVKHRKSVYR